jgi:N6-adenosine-specific RNA methylase IME4
VSELGTARAAWADRIAAAWQKSVEGVIEVGRLLTEAKAALDHGAFTEMIERDLPFKARTAQRLMAIAADERLSNPTHVSLLPPHWGTLYELTKLSNEQFEAKIASGAIHPEMERRDVVKVDARERRAEREAELGSAQAALPGRRYGVILADPPWTFSTYSDLGQDRGPAMHYPTMAPDAIKAIDVAAISAPDCVLFLWAVQSALPQALEVIAAWGFTYKTGAVWVKDKIGMGYWFRSRHEPLLIATRGDVPAPAMGTQAESVVVAPAREHSRKPDIVYELVERYFPNLPKIELFARASLPGWDCWGNEAPTAPSRAGSAGRRDRGVGGAMTDLTIAPPSAAAKSATTWANRLEGEALAYLFGSLAVSLRESFYQGHDHLARAHVAERGLVLIEIIRIVKKLDGPGTDGGPST